MDNDIKATLLAALDVYQGDDGLRARKLFEPAIRAGKMNEPHGDSGLTRAQVLEQYETRERKIEAAKEWVIAYAGRDRIELQREHDKLVGIIMRECPFPDLPLTMRDYNQMASVLCWCLGHDHNPQFSDALDAIEKDLKVRGYTLDRETP